MLFQSRTEFDIRFFPYLFPYIFSFPRFCYMIHATPLRGIGASHVARLEHKAIIGLLSESPAESRSLSTWTVENKSEDLIWHSDAPLN